LANQSLMGRVMQMLGNPSPQALMQTLGQLFQRGAPSALPFSATPGGMGQPQQMPGAQPLNLPPPMMGTTAPNAIGALGNQAQQPDISTLLQALSQFRSQ